MKRFLILLLVALPLLGYSQLTTNIRRGNDISLCGKQLTPSQRKEVNKRTIYLVTSLACVFAISEATKSNPNKNYYNGSHYLFAGVSLTGCYYVLKPVFSKTKRYK